MHMQYTTLYIYSEHNLNLDNISPKKVHNSCKIVIYAPITREPKLCKIDQAAHS